jgi:hypothetical protein
MSFQGEVQDFVLTEESGKGEDTGYGKGPEEIGPDRKSVV